MAKKRKTVDAGLEKTLQQYEQRFPDPQLSVAPLCQRVREAVESGDPALAAGVAILLGRVIGALAAVPVMLPEVRRRVKTTVKRKAARADRESEVRAKFTRLRQQGVSSKEDRYRKIEQWLVEHFDDEHHHVGREAIRRYCEGLE